LKIAFFDSGIGGLSVLHHAIKILPNEEFIFFADEDNVPYGTKTVAQVLKYVDDAFKFLVAQKVDAIVVACNTATSAAVRKMREKYPALIIIGMEPAIKVALDLFPNKKVLVTATEITVRGEKIKNLIAKLNAEKFVVLRALSKLVEFAERQEFNSATVENYLRGELAGYDFENFSSLVLGCTHFNYFKDTLKKILPSHIKFLDGNEGTINYLIKLANLKPELQTKKIPQIEYFYSGRKVTQSEELLRLEKYLRRLDEMYLI